MHGIVINILRGPDSFSILKVKGQDDCHVCTFYLLVFDFPEKIIAILKTCIFNAVNCVTEVHEICY